jgi:hypothetical protein
MCWIVVLSSGDLTFFTKANLAVVIFDTRNACPETVPFLDSYAGIPSMNVSITNTKRYIPLPQRPQCERVAPA